MKEDIVYELWYRREYEDRDDTELRIGLFRTRKTAEELVEKLRHQPGFRDWPEGFEIGSTRLDEGNFLEGFKTSFGPPPKDAQSEAFDLPYWVETGDGNE